MKVCGVIVEYNPFHNGHKFHIEKAREISSADYVIAVMSGSFTQRGEPAIFDKFTRAKTAILGGVDLVLELPFCFSCAPAQFFSEGAVKTLSSTGTVDSICFGSECGDTSLLSKSDKAGEEIKDILAKGASYPSACAAVSDFPLSSPNDILGAEYLRAISLYAPEITPFTIKRNDSGYHSDKPCGKFASASYIRNCIYDNGISSVKEFLPNEVYEILKNEYSNRNYTDFSLLDSLILGKIRSGGNLKDSAYVAEGLENRFYDLSFSAGSIKELADSVKTKRYTYARLMRILSCFAVGLTDKKLLEFVTAGPRYLRVLGSNNKGKHLLSEMKKRASLPIITTPSAYKELENTAREMFEIDCLSADIASLAIKNPALRSGRQDFKKLNIFCN